MREGRIGLTTTGVRWGRGRLGMMCDTDRPMHSCIVVQGVGVGCRHTNSFMGH